MMMLWKRGFSFLWDPWFAIKRLIYPPWKLAIPKAILVFQPIHFQVPTGRFREGGECVQPDENIVKIESNPPQDLWTFQQKSFWICLFVFFHGAEPHGRIRKKSPSCKPEVLKCDSRSGPPTPKHQYLPDGTPFFWWFCCMLPADSNSFF